MPEKIPSPFYVIVRFELKPGEIDTLAPLIREFIAKEVSRTPGFISARLHTNEEGTLLINYATWKSPDAFHSFLAEVAGASPRAQRIDAFHPRVDRIFEMAG